jgi:hypothetical protein
MAYLRSLWALAVTFFEVHFGAADKWWPMGVYAGIGLVACGVVGLADLQRHSDLVVSVMCYVCIVMLGIILRKWRGSPTQRPVQVLRAALVNNR